MTAIDLRTIKENANLDALTVVALTRLMALTGGRPDIRIGLIDGPVKTDHPDFAGASIELLSQRDSGIDAASHHGTSVAAILIARRGSVAPAICPNATLLVRPILSIASQPAGAATPDELASAVVETIDAGAAILNLSLALAPKMVTSAAQLQEALNYALSCRAIVVAATGNQAIIGGSIITCHPAVIPVVAYGLQGHPVLGSNFGALDWATWSGRAGRRYNQFRSRWWLAPIWRNKRGRGVRHWCNRSLVVGVPSGGSGRPAVRANQINISSIFYCSTIDERLGSIRKAATADMRRPLDGQASPS